MEKLANQKKEYLMEQVMIILTKTGEEIEIKKEKLDLFLEHIKKVSFVKVGNNVINVKNIAGIYEPEVILKRDKRKRGYWFCDGKGKHELVELAPGQKCGYCSNR